MRLLINVLSNFKEIIKKGVMWKWNDKCNKSPGHTKNILISVLSLTHFNLDLEIIEALVDSDYGIEAVICHKFNACKIKTVAYASRTLITAETN